MPLNQAVYDPYSDKIYGVRGQWVYRFNATTASKEAEVRYYSRSLGSAEIVTFSGNLYIAPKNHQYRVFTRNSGDLAGGFAYPSYSGGGVNFCTPDKDIFVVNSGLQTTNRLNGYRLLSFTNLNDWQEYRNMVVITGILGVPTGVVWGDSSNLHGWSFHNSGDLRENVDMGYSTDQMVYDATNSLIWTVDAQNSDIWALDLSGITWFVGRQFTSNQTYVQPEDFQYYGITYSASANAAYAVAGDSKIVRISGEQAVEALRGVGDNPGYQLFSLGQTGINPVRISACPYAYHPYSGKALIPTWYGDTVIVWDCLNNIVSSTKLGFSSPIDIVWTPNSVFAVQNSETGLKEIT